MPRFLFQSGLFENTIQGARRYIQTRFACNGHGAWFGGMLELPMASGGADEQPAIIFEQFEHLFDFHAGLFISKPQWKDELQYECVCGSVPHDAERGKYTCVARGGENAERLAASRTEGG